MVPEIYIFGFSASFNDSTVYFTNVQQVEKAWIDTKTKFLQGCAIYTQQLKSYFESKGLSKRTCVVFYGLTRKQAEKKFLKMKKLYTIKSPGKFNVNYLQENDFKFSPVNISESTITQEEDANEQ